MPGRIVGMDERNGTRLRADQSPQRFDVQVPTVIVKQRIRGKAYVLELCQKVEERIAWLGDQHLIACVCKQAEEVAVGFAGAGGEKDAFRIDRDTVVPVISGDGFASR